MSLPFDEQLRLVTSALGPYFDGQQHITVCVGSGASRGSMPMLETLISRTFFNLPVDEGSCQLFLKYSRSKFFAESLVRRRLSSSNPTTFDEFRALQPEVRDYVCKPICETYGDFFRDIQDFVGSKDRLLDLIEFNEFRRGEPNPSHYYMAYLILEGKLQKIVTTNWDLLIEATLNEVSPPSLRMNLHIIRDHRPFSTGEREFDFSQKYMAAPVSFLPTLLRS